QIILKMGNQRILGFIDATEPTHPTQIFRLGNWTLSDVRLEDEENLVAVRVNKMNEISQSIISMNIEILEWKKIDYTASGEIKGIEIKGDHVEGSDDGRFFKIPLLVNTKSNEETLTEKELQAVVNLTSATTPDENPSNTWLLIVVSFLIVLAMMAFICWYCCDKLLCRRCTSNNPDIPLQDPQQYEDQRQPLRTNDGSENTANRPEENGNNQDPLASNVNGVPEYFQVYQQQQDALKSEVQQLRQDIQKYKSQVQSPRTDDQLENTVNRPEENRNNQGSQDNSHPIQPQERDPLLNPGDPDRFGDK
ncbi:hypothetical protein FO519_010018, partial [Halicephalobus sp. NKZ332]